MVIVDIPYLMTKYWWDNVDMFDKGTIRDLASGLKRYTNVDSVVKVYSSHQQINPIKKRLAAEAHLRVGKNPYFWILSGDLPRF